MFVFTYGMRVTTLLGELDSDEDGQDRITPPGTCGTLQAAQSDNSYCLELDNGAAVYLSEEDLLNPKAYRIEGAAV